MTPHPIWGLHRRLARAANHHSIYRPASSRAYTSRPQKIRTTTSAVELFVEPSPRPSRMTLYNRNSNLLFAAVLCSLIIVGHCVVPSVIIAEPALRCRFSIIALISLIGSIYADRNNESTATCCAPVQPTPVTAQSQLHNTLSHSLPMQLKIQYDTQSHTPVTTLPLPLHTRW